MRPLYFYYGLPLSRNIPIEVSFLKNSASTSTHVLSVPWFEKSVYVVCTFIFKLESSVIEIVEKWKLPIFGTRTQIDADLKAET